MPMLTVSLPLSRPSSISWSEHPKLVFYSHAHSSRLMCNTGPHRAQSPEEFFSSPCLPLNMCVLFGNPFNELKSASLLTSTHWSVCAPVIKGSSTFLPTWQLCKHCKTASAPPWVLSVLNFIALYTGKREAHQTTNSRPYLVCKDHHTGILHAYVLQRETFSYKICKIVQRYWFQR